MAHRKPRASSTYRAARRNEARLHRLFKVWKLKTTTRYVPYESRGKKWHVIKSENDGQETPIEIT
jgi:hypothetical protein